MLLNFVISITSTVSVCSLYRLMKKLHWFEFKKSRSTLLAFSLSLIPYYIFSMFSEYFLMICSNQNQNEHLQFCYMHKKGTIYYFLISLIEVFNIPTLIICSPFIFLKKTDDCLNGINKLEDQLIISVFQRSNIQQLRFSVLTNEGDRKTRVTTYKSIISNLVNGSRGSSSLVENDNQLTMSTDSVVSEYSKFSGEFNVFKSQYTSRRDEESSNNALITSTGGSANMPQEAHRARLNSQMSKQSAMNDKQHRSPQTTSREHQGVIASRTASSRTMNSQMLTSSSRKASVSNTSRSRNSPTLPIRDNLDKEIFKIK